MYSFALDLREFLSGDGFSGFLAFFCFVWALWLLKFGLAAFHRPKLDGSGVTSLFRVSVIVPVFNEPPELFARVLASVRANDPDELIVVVDGGDAAMAEIGLAYADTVRRIPKAGKRVAIETGLAASDPETDVVVVVDSDTIWERDTLDELLKGFADPRVGGVTPRQMIFDHRTNLVRRLAGWIEDLRYSLTVPAQSLLGQVGCLAGRTIAYRREAFEPAVRELVAQRVLGLQMTIGDDRVLTNSLLRNKWRTVYQPSAVVTTDAPNAWRPFFHQQLRWARSSQRETLLCLTWLWRRPFALVCFLSDIVIPFALYGLVVCAVARSIGGLGDATAPIPIEICLAYLGTIGSIGLRQIPHFRRYRDDAKFLPLFVIVLAGVMAPLRILALATMFGTSWGTRAAVIGRAENAVAVEVSALAA
jgi:hyaluronan synthase